MHYAFNVWLNNRLIDTVFYNSMPTKTIKASIEDAYQSLVDHAGYDSNIKVTWPKGQTVNKTKKDK